MVKILAKYLQRRSFSLKLQVYENTNSKNYNQRFGNTLLLWKLSSVFFLWSETVTERCSTKGRPVLAAKEFDKYLEKNLIFKKVRHTVGVSQKLKSPLLGFGICVYRCRRTLSEYLSVAAFNKPSYVWEKR